MIKVLEKQSIKIFNYDFELLGIISDYESLILERNFYEAGDFELHINIAKQSANKITTNSWLMLGNNTEKCLIVETIEKIYSDNKQTLVVRGADLKGLIKRRVTYTDNFDRIGPTEAENVIKHYINNHFIDSKLAISPFTSLTERNMSVLQVTATQNRGPFTVWQSRFENVHDVIKEISEDTGLGWEVYADLVNKKFIFNVTEGTDRSINQTDVPQILFTKQKGNIKESKYYNDLAGFKNVGYVGGKGENEDRPVIVRGSGEGLARREVFIDLNNIDDLDELISEGDKKLGEYKQLVSIEGKVFSIDNMEYEVDWFLGDKVSIKIEDIVEHKVVTQVKEIYERNNMNIEVAFGDKLPTIIDELKKQEGVVK